MKKQTTLLSLIPLLAGSSLIFGYQTVQVFDIQSKLHMKGGATNCYACEKTPTGPCYTYTDNGKVRVYTEVTNPDCQGNSVEIVEGKYKKAECILPNPPSSAACNGPAGVPCGYMVGCNVYGGVCQGS
jgi:hypothetical protein